jgi:hypothetical protein
MSRLANGVRSAGLMRRAVNEALFIASNREAFGKRLIELPLMQRQLAKMLVTAEQGRSMVFHTARVLERADNGDEQMARVLRILTPLIKFRTCRDARKVAGDAMEVRGGCGYIEEWSDARVLRDSHLGSIWEGTSNIVALDVARAARREGALEALQGYVEGLLDEAGPSTDAHRSIAERFAGAKAYMATVAGDREREIETRSTATALYNATSAAFLAWEDAKLRQHSNDYAGDRLAIAQQVLQHKLSARDPLSGGVREDATSRDLLQRALAGATTHARRASAA